MDLLAEYHFVDCLVIDIRMDEHFASCEIVCECYSVHKVAGNSSAPQRMHIKLMDCDEVNAKIKTEFWQDVKRPYHLGRTYKANEIRSISLVSNGAGGTDQHVMQLNADMVILGVKAKFAQTSVTPF